MRRAVVQTLSGPVVERIHRIIDLDLSDTCQAHLLGEVLSQQSIVVLIESSLPRAIGVGEVHLGVQTSRVRHQMT